MSKEEIKEIIDDFKEIGIKETIKDFIGLSIIFTFFIIWIIVG